MRKVSILTLASSLRRCLASASSLLRSCSLRLARAAASFCSLSSCTALSTLSSIDLASAAALAAASAHYQ